MSRDEEPGIVQFPMSKLEENWDVTLYHDSSLPKGYVLLKLRPKSEQDNSEIVEEIADV